MKKLFLALALLSIVVAGFSQANPSRKVKKAFAEKYRGADQIAWESNGERRPEWTARYTMDDADMLTEYNYKGEWLHTLIFIDPAELPETIKAELDAGYEGYKIVKAAQMEAPDFSGYAAAVEHSDNRFEFQFTPEGKIVRRNLKSINLY